jgi:SLT domain-containing protein
MAGNVGHALLNAIGLGGGSSGSGSPGAVGAGVERWRGVVDAVLAQLGQPTSLDNGVLSLIQHESGGNPNAINLTDSNAKAGHPSQGLMQTIPSTFAANAGPYASRGITDPFANIYAGVSYALKNYGPAMLAAGGRHNAAGQYIGYDSGGTLDPGYHMVYNGTGQTEIVAPRQTFEQAMSGASGGSVFHLYDSDGVLMGTMRGQAESVVSGALTGMASTARAGVRL